MADRKRKSWGTFKNEMKAKRRQTGDGVGKKNEEGNVLEREELVVQRLRSSFQLAFSDVQPPSRQCSDQEGIR